MTVYGPLDARERQTKFRLMKDFSLSESELLKKMENHRKKDFYSGKSNVSIFDNTQKENNSIEFNSNNNSKIFLNQSSKFDLNMTKENQSSRLPSKSIINELEKSTIHSKRMLRNYTKIVPIKQLKLDLETSKQRI